MKRKYETKIWKEYCIYIIHKCHENVLNLQGSRHILAPMIEVPAPLLHTVSSLPMYTAEQLNFILRDNRGQKRKAANGNKSASKRVHAALDPRWAHAPNVPTPPRLPQAPRAPPTRAVNMNALESLAVNEKIHVLKKRTSAPSTEMRLSLLPNVPLQLPSAPKGNLPKVFTNTINLPQPPRTIPDNTAKVKSRLTNLRRTRLMDKVLKNHNIAHVSVFGRSCGVEAII